MPCTVAVSGGGAGNRKPHSRAREYLGNLGCDGVGICYNGCIISFDDFNIYCNGSIINYNDSIRCFHGSIKHYDECIMDFNASGICYDKFIIYYDVKITQFFVATYVLLAKSSDIFMIIYHFMAKRYRLSIVTFI